MSCVSILPIHIESNRVNYPLLNSFFFIQPSPLRDAFEQIIHFNQVHWTWNSLLFQWERKGDIRFQNGWIFFLYQRDRLIKLTTIG